MNNDHDSSLPEGFDLRALSAFVDGELPLAERAAIEAQLAQQPQAAARVAAWRAQKAALQALCGAPLRNERNEPTSVVSGRARPMNPLSSWCGGRLRGGNASASRRAGLRSARASRLRWGRSHHA